MPPSRLFAPLYANTGSVARDHLASERTFLAWMRTGLGFVALGIAIERFSQLDPELFLSVRAAEPAEKQARTVDSSAGSALSSGDALPARDARSAHDLHRHKESLLALSMLGTGCGSIFYGAARYFSNLRQLERGFFKPAYHGAGVLSVGVACLAGGAWWSSRERTREMEGRG